MRKGSEFLMPNILLTRIDNRLVHGQVGVTWVNHLGANLMVVANDEVAEDEVQQDLMDMVVPGTIGVRFFPSRQQSTSFITQRMTSISSWL